MTCAGELLLEGEKPHYPDREVALLTAEQKLPCYRSTYSGPIMLLEMQTDTSFFFSAARKQSNEWQILKKKEALLDSEDEIQYVLL